MKPIHWSLKELAELFNNRRKNEFDVNLLVTGGTGMGKSSIILKLLKRFKGFKQKKHQVYSRPDTIKLLRDQKFSFCWNDELITSGFKRTHYEKEQIDLIGTLTKYRCNFNIFAAALPVFFTLDKELIKLFSINIDIIRRGIGVIHMRKEGRRYSDDPWDTKYNAKLEEKWSKRLEKNPNFKIPYHKYSTFVGYVYFNKPTEKQKIIYEKIRDEKKAVLDRMREEENADEKKDFYEHLLDRLRQGKISKEILQEICLSNNKKYYTVTAGINKILCNNGEKERVKDLLLKNDNFFHNNPKIEINTLTSDRV